MNQLSQAFAALAAENRKQFVAAKIVPALNSDGTQQTKPNGALRWDKIPVTEAGYDLSWNDPANLLIYEQAYQRCRSLALIMPDIRWDVGHIFTEDDGYVFLDFDSAKSPIATPDDVYRYLDPWGWPCTETAAMAFQHFPGAAFEISSSNLGYHIVFKAVTTLKLSCKAKDAPIECYTGRKFMLFGHSAIGDCRIDHTAAFNVYVAHYKLDKTTSHTGIGDVFTQWEAAIAEGTHPAATKLSKEEVLDLLFRKGKTADNLFVDGKNDFQKLYEGELLKFPSHSEADMSFFCQLAWATGNNAALMEEIAYESERATQRDKWHTRKARILEDMLLARQHALAQTPPFYRADFYKSTSRGQITGSMGNSQASSANTIPIGVSIGIPEQQVLFKDLVYVVDENRIILPNGELANEATFKATSPYANHIYTFKMEGTPCDNAWKVFTQSKLFTKTQVDSRCFRPDIPDQKFLKEDGRILFNEYRPLRGKRLKGDPTPFLNHIAKMIPDARDQEIFLCYLAAVVQHLGTKFRWAVLLQGTEGNGKSLIAECIQYCIGKEYCSSINAQRLNDPFNVWLYRKIFITVEEVHTLDRKLEAGDRLKDIITNFRPSINAKGLAVIDRDVCCNFLLNSNHRQAIRITEDARRFAIFFTAQQSLEDKLRDGMTPEYFDGFGNWLRQQDGFAITHELFSTYPINPQFNPARGGDAPFTTSRQIAIEESRGAVEQEILEAVDQEIYGFRGDWISSAQLTVLLERLGMAAKIPPQRRGKILESLGYVKHPALRNGQVDNVLPDEKGKPRLYIKRNSPLIHTTSPIEVAKTYLEIQKKPLV